VANDVLKLDNQLCFPLYAASRLVTQAYRPHLDKLGITYSQYLVLIVLWERDGQTVTEIGDRLFLDSGTLTPVLKRMEQNGLIRRARRGDDTRIVENRLTPAGRKLKRRAAKVPVALLCEVGLSMKETEELRATIDEFVGKLVRMGRR
jgi:MarR family transcriptional regulator, organic hydroperoxide resistance regulator